jgi:hypothetical protein
MVGLDLVDLRWFSMEMQKLSVKIARLLQCGKMRRTD